ncbi:hypothetical protein IFM89_022069 [Coptis chinensis]|uniref:Rab3 GTPase-activating protein catalytic subunit n=1 Tax=Coptis chinensis TaxID=261450 RepID=A0A835H6U8_9MAGN|nr:hypothetical protein IFM89_022069 [Coptis chinensis]
MDVFPWTWVLTTTPDLVVLKSSSDTSTLHGAIIQGSTPWSCAPCGFDLITIWSNKMVEGSSVMAELENASSHEAENWFLVPVLSPNLPAARYERIRIASADHSPESAYSDDACKGNAIGFASQLRLLINALDISFRGQFIEDFVSGPDDLKSSATVPPPTVLDRVLKDLFHEGMQIPDYSKGEHKSSRAIKGSPLESLFAQFCLHSLWFGDCNIRALAGLWKEFVREVRWFWEEAQMLPRMQCNGSVDLSTCLIHQKLQMLAICIDKKRQSDSILQDMGGSNHHNSPHSEDGSLVGGKRTQSELPTELRALKRDSPLRADGRYDSKTRIESAVGPDDAVAFGDKSLSEKSRRGTAGVAGSMMLLNSYQMMHTPYTQDAPIMTEDMHEERLRVVEAFGNAFSFSGQLEKDILSSDMSAFKAVNPDAVFEDFIRWHSPGDWETAELEDQRYKVDKLEGVEIVWPPRGRLSTRMSEHGNSWRQIWNNVPALPASEQKPLLDPNREGEKILHYLEIIRPHVLLEQMVCTAFRASADSLNQTSFGGFKQMKTKIAQLYLTMASTLKPLQANDLPNKGEVIDDLRRLSIVFEHVEKMLTFAASVHRKMSLAPRLSKVIFEDFFNFYLPRMGTSSAGGHEDKRFDMKQRVRMHERRAVENLFKHPTANQSWRKVLSMGNLLNGHEPILREIIFCKHDNVSENYYGGSTGSNQEIKTHRMYVCGTSNDLRVALSVTSSD